MKNQATRMEGSTDDWEWMGPPAAACRNGLAAHCQTQAGRVVSKDKFKNRYSGSIHVTEKIVLSQVYSCIVTQTRMDQGVLAERIFYYAFEW